MKRVLVFIFTAMLSLAIASPGFALVNLTKSLSLGINVYTAHYFYHGDKEFMAKGVPAGQTTLKADAERWESFSNTTSVMIIRWAMPNYGLVLIPNIDSDKESLGVPIAYGYWYITPKLRFQVGKGTSLFSEIQPHAATAGGEQKATGIAYGNYFTGYNAYARVQYRIGRGEIKAGIVDPRATDGIYINTLGFTSNGGKIDNASVIPKFELAYWYNLPTRAVRAQIQTSAFWQKQTFDNVKGPDNEVVSYGLGLGLDGDLGPVHVMAEVTYGQNWFNTRGYGYPIMQTFLYYPSLFTNTVSGCYGGKVDKAGNMQNAKLWAGFIEAGYKIGPARPSLIFGRMSTERSVNGLKDNVILKEYGVRCPIQVHKNLEISPEFMIFDNGIITVGGKDYDFGKEWSAGAVFSFRF
ncbi:MAG: hypothetical protein JW943_07635 [Deltaproteobacteria bacterium]|nr:hypothetical protein [Deltaproteobacteria bacterium]